MEQNYSIKSRGIKAILAGGLTGILLGFGAIAYGGDSDLNRAGQALGATGSYISQGRATEAAAKGNYKEANFQINNARNLNLLGTLNGVLGDMTDNSEREKEAAAAAQQSEEIKRNQERILEEMKRNNQAENNYKTQNAPQAKEPETKRPKILMVKELLSADDKILALGYNDDLGGDFGIASNKALGEYFIQKKFGLKEKINNEDKFISKESWVIYDLYKNEQYGYYLLETKRKEQTLKRKQ